MCKEEYLVLELPVVYMKCKDNTIYQMMLRLFMFACCRGSIWNPKAVSY